MAGKEMMFLFVLGVACLEFLSIKTIHELFHVIKNIPSLVVFHPKHGENDENEHLHVFIAVQANRAHAKIQCLMRQLDSVLRDYIVSRFKFNEHLKKINTKIDLDQLEAIIASIFGYEGFESNAMILSDKADELTKSILERIGNITTPLELNCLAFLEEPLLQKLHIFSGNVKKSFFGINDESSNDDGKSKMMTPFPSNEATE